MTTILVQVIRWALDLDAAEAEMQRQIDFWTLPDYDDTLTN